MQFKALTAFSLAAFTVAATAAPTASNDGNPCNTGSIQCCNQTAQPSDPALATIFGLLGITVGSITGLVGLTCSPLSVIGVSGTSCSAQPVCCSNNSFNGLVALGCTPINLNL